MKSFPGRCSDGQEWTQFVSPRCCLHNTPTFTNKGLFLVYLWKQLFKSRRHHLRRLWNQNDAFKEYTSIKSKHCNCCDARDNKPFGYIEGPLALLGQRLVYLDSTQIYTAESTVHFILFTSGSNNYASTICLPLLFTAHNLRCFTKWRLHGNQSSTVCTSLVSKIREGNERSCTTDPFLAYFKVQLIASGRWRSWNDIKIAPLSLKLLHLFAGLLRYPRICPSLLLCSPTGMSATLLFREESCRRQQ